MKRDTDPKALLRLRPLLTGYKTMEPENDAFKNIECPNCSTDVTLSLPRSATITSVVAGSPNTTHDADDDATERRREHEKSCSNGHTISVVYDW